jgi:hypothetical protein
MKKTETLPELVSLYLDTTAASPDLDQRLYQAVLDLLLHDTAALYQVLYRIDVSEAKVKAVFEDAPLAEEAASRIVALIMARQQEKLYWRRKYQSDDSTE